MVSILISSCGKDAELSKACLPENLTEGLIAFYPFNNGSLSDESSNNNNLTNSTSAAFAIDRNGNSDCAYQFDGNKTDDEFLSTTNTSFLNGLDEFSVSVWYQPLNSARDGGIFEVLLSRGVNPSCPNRRGEWSIGLYDCRRAVFGHDNSVWANTVTGFSTGCEGEVIELTDKWHHVVVIKTSDEYKIYFNGNLDESKSGIALCSRNSHTAEDIGDLIIGTDYTGRIDDILIYNKELSQAEVTELFQLEACCK